MSDQRTESDFFSEIDEVRRIVDKIPEDYRRLQAVAEAAGAYVQCDAVPLTMTVVTHDARVALRAALRAAGYLKDTPQATGEFSRDLDESGNPVPYVEENR